MKHSVLPAALVLGLSASALPAGAEGAAAAPAAPLPAPASAPVPALADAMRLHKLVEGWLALGEVPATTASELWADKAVGVVVTLRLEGVSMGQGQAVRVDGADVFDGKETKPVDLVPLLMEASRQAFAQANARLLETPGAGKNPLATLADMLCVDVQVGHSPAPVLAGKEGASDEVFAQVSPGWHGMALRPAAGGAAAAPALAWPGTLTAQGVATDTALNRMLVAAKISEADAKKLARPGGPRLSTFEVFHIVRPRRALPPMALTRGTVVVPESAITMDTLRALDGRVAEHLLAKVTADGNLRGGYRVADDAWMPAVATPAEAALAAYALARAASSRLAANPRDEFGVHCVEGASKLAKVLAPKVSDAKAAPQPLASALLLLTLTDAPGGADRDLRDRLAADLMALDTGETGYAVKGAPAPPAPPGVVVTAPEAKPVGRTAGAIITCALAAWYERTRDVKAEAIVRRQLDKAFGGSEGFETAEAAYWLVLAQRRAGLALAAADKDPEKARRAHGAHLERALLALEEMRAEQIQRAPDNGPADVVGGFAFGKSGLPLPTWHGAFVMAVWGQLLQEPGVIAADARPGHLRAVSRGARFMAQLVVTPAACFACRQPAAAVGGVRGAPWDTRLDTQPAAMTLIALEEVLAGVGKK